MPHFVRGFRQACIDNDKPIANHQRARRHGGNSTAMYGNLRHLTAECHQHHRPSNHLALSMSSPLIALPSGASHAPQVGGISVVWQNLTLFAYRENQSPI